MGNSICGVKKKSSSLALQTAKDDGDFDDNGDFDDDGEVKLVLFGCGEAGKSTLRKQLNIIHSSGLTIEERLQYKVMIYENLFSFMWWILSTAKKHNIHLSCFDETNAQDNNNNMDGRRRIALRRTLDEVEQMLHYRRYDEELDAELIEIVETLWRHDNGVQETIERFENEMQLPIAVSTAAYFIDNLPRLKEDNNIPTDHDVIQCRVRTTGVIEYEFVYRGRKFRLLDVGGIRSERRCWYHCSEKLKLVIYCVDLSEYDRVLCEDNYTNRLKESLLIFGGVCNCRWLQKTTIVLLFNKTDLFQQKLLKTDLRMCFPDYEGGKDYTKVVH
eukprot:TRINITY_DN3241_c0_g1_i1.p1 TRINITY_DN3241_c0_g1~~TRINITY_DN3241_c0_g1_i1.p1  ORF type:complete len:330 (+),score=68.67 TRINITY_DN3241_c0_g1_i1:206-1195(+)